ncbi:MAG: UDP-Glc:alpha-D-GlcNAc-diphosphoundecaprenol beta-1,3-glucosyltransferase WfgD [Candidatus Moanabacter tarae]|uniref:UDP-Glc:alpha-D-GlcNAc-diphosphoundecaprenol beta-1,3-glucosyltransferase WfgD n=1 Tax=Candidatus Moanibacter tarae TaxID=2200854 RepID=A0A2Z4AFT9_9BACT|nr:MAG: UDP-Glc:alpha-D-GlcNAc-diphosphoundecaprenol beta-1,3-glucosyltransferase WfgD [Candidatus Moanabacter tarae]|tara:strand:- start:5399 stop:6259 length:861 start_codon:yes stop_codon:yes gene_type:complete
MKSHRSLESVTVIIPTYNRRSLLPRALDSVLNQTALPSEIIVVDDGSSDGTRDLIQTKYSSVRLIEQENQGVSQARNRGIKKAAGEWIAFLDSDDEWLPQKLEIAFEALNQNPDYLICHSGEIWIRKGKRVAPPARYAKSGGYIFKECLPVCMISPSTVIIHRNIFATIGLFDASLQAAEDYDMWLRISVRYPILYLPDLLTIKFDGHSEQLSHQWGIDRYRIRALEKILKSPYLRGEEYVAALAILTEKCKIFANGARKRGKLQEANFYTSVASQFLLDGTGKKE